MLPAGITQGSQSVISWTVLFPGDVQKPTPRVCTLSAKSVCTGGVCNATQLTEEENINSVIESTEKTDANDPEGSRTILVALNAVTDTAAHIASGDTDWKGSGKKTITLNNTMDFTLDCSKPNTGVHGLFEKQTVRVNVTNSNEN